MSLGVAAVPLRVLSEEGFDEWLVEVGTVTGWALDGQVGDEWCCSHLDVRLEVSYKVVVCR